MSSASGNVGPSVGIQEYIIWREAMARDEICKITDENNS